MANEKRLIDANALRKQMFSYYGCVNENSSKEYYRGETLMNYEVADLIEDCIDNAPTVDAVYRGVHDQVRWERDIAIGQLESYGISLGEKADVAKVVHGRWEDEHGGKYANPRYRCSVCKAKALYKFERDLLDNWKEVQALTPICPYCMAKLDGGIGNDIQAIQTMVQR